MNNLEALEIIKAYKEKLESSCSNQLNKDIEAFNLAIAALDEGRPRGKWVVLPPCCEEICYCTNCKEMFKQALQWSDTCPNCGAIMDIK